MSELPDVRVSDAERERVADALRHHAGEGRIDTDELDERLTRAYSARTRSELGGLTADLPAYTPPLRPAERRRQHIIHAREAVGAWAGTAVLCTGIWAFTGHGAFWPGIVMVVTGIPLVRGAITGDWERARRQSRRHHRHGRGRGRW